MIYNKPVIATIVSHNKHDISFSLIILFISFSLKASTNKQIDQASADIIVYCVKIVAITAVYYECRRHGTVYLGPKYTKFSLFGSKINSWNSQ